MCETNKTYRAVGKKTGDLQVEVEARGHRIIIDEPINSGGEDTGMNPVELLLSSIAACQTITVAIYAEAMQINVDEVSVEVEGDMDSKGFQGHPNIRPGFSNIRTHIKIKSDSPEPSIKQLVDMVELRCPVEDTVKNGTNVAKITVDVLKG